MLLHGSMTAILTEENLGSVPKYIIKCKRLIFCKRKFTFYRVEVFCPSYRYFNCSSLQYSGFSIYWSLVFSCSWSSNSESWTLFCSRKSAIHLSSSWSWNSSCKKSIKPGKWFCILRFILDLNKKIMNQFLKSLDQIFLNRQ